MGVNLVSETYKIDRPDIKGVPASASIVIVNYEREGKVGGIFYGVKPIPFNAETAREDQKKMDEAVTAINLNNQTQEEMEEVVGLLRKLSSR